MNPTEWTRCMDLITTCTGNKEKQCNGQLGWFANDWARCQGCCCFFRERKTYWLSISRNFCSYQYSYSISILAPVGFDSSGKIVTNIRNDDFYVNHMRPRFFQWNEIFCTSKKMVPIVLWRFSLIPDTKTSPFSILLHSFIHCGMSLAIGLVAPYGSI